MERKINVKIADLTREKYTRNNISGKGVIARTTTLHTKQELRAKEGEERMHRQKRKRNNQITCTQQI